jgi:hypothetical protein
MSDNHVSFYVGEVISLNDAYKIKDNRDTKFTQPFSINIQTKIDNVKRVLENVIPANSNIKQIPLLGENVLVFQGYNSSTSYRQRTYQWYYLSVYNIQSNINHNIVPTISTNFSPDTEFTETTVAALQPFKGDILIEGRWGNTIRLSNTNKNSTTYSLPPNWGGDTVTDPIIILSNKQNNNEFVVENIDSDLSSIYLTTSQRLNTLKLHNNLNQSSDTSTAFNKSQFVAAADRIVLTSKTDVVALDSNKSIELNSPLLSIGNKQNSEKEYGLHSTAVIELFDQFFYLITLGGLKDSSGMPIIVDTTFTDTFFKIREKLSNLKIRQDKGDI